MGRGNKIYRLYLLDARAQLLGQERTNYASTTQKRTWDQWHKNFGHIAIPSLERLYREKMVDRMAVDESSIPSKSCEACIQAKQAHKSFLQEAELYCPRSGPGPVRALFADLGPGPQVQVQSFLDLDLDTSTTVY